jgi:hypothetical protein
MDLVSYGKNGKCDFRANCNYQDVSSTFADGPAWSPRTVRRKTAVDECEKTKTPEERERQELETIHVVFEALKPFQAAQDAVMRALERAAEKERKR